MKPKFEYNLNRNFELRVVIFFLVVVLILLGSYTQKKSDENEALKTTLGVLGSSVEQEKAKNEQRFDSLQQRIRHQEHLQLRWKDSLQLMKNQRLLIKTRTDENKAAIHRLRDADSLYHAVARHYQ